MSKASFHIPSLDGIRAIAVLVVFLSHSTEILFKHAGNPFPGFFAVTVFFFLSGYLITTLLRREFDATDRISFKQFYLRRTGRIMPAFYLVLAAIALTKWAGILPGENVTAHLVCQALFITNYYPIFFGPSGGGSGVFWSLSVEEHYYLIFPLIFYFLSKWRFRYASQAVILSGICVLFLIWRCVLVYHFGEGVERVSQATDTRADSIFFGSILALAGNPMMDPWKGSDKLWKFVLFPIAMLTIGFTLVYRDPVFRETFRYTVQGVAIFIMFTAAIRYPDWLPFKVLNTKLLGWIGAISYPLYLVHYPILQFFKEIDGLPKWAVVTLGFGTSVAVSWAIFRFVEKPASRWIRQFGAKNRKPAEQSSTPTLAEPSNP